MERAFVTVADVMNASLHVIDGLATVREALSMMNERKVGSLVIERRHEGDEYAMITVYDIAEKVVSLNRSVDRTSVYEVMTKPVLVLGAGMNIRYAIRMLARLQHSRALVSQSDAIVGIVTLRDMVVRYVDSAEPAPTPGA